MNTTRRGVPRLQRRRRKEQCPLTPGQALELLQSAMYYCQRAGLSVQCKSDADLKGLVLYLPEVQSVTTSKGVRFALAES